jgi:sugar/nucleoside kinase (ribokinase family)
MKGCGIDTRGMKKEPEINTSSVIVMVSSYGERTFLYCPGATEELAINDIDFSLIEHCKILHTGGVMKLPKLDVVSMLKKAKDFIVI